VIRTASFALALLFPVLACCDEAREWTDRTGRKFTAEIIANDAFRATFALPDRRKIVLPLAQLSEADAAHVGKWREEHPHAPFVDPGRLAPWPAEAAASDIEIDLKSQNATPPAFVYEGAHFLVQADVKLPIGVVRDLNAVLEATRTAVMALPFGLHSGSEGKTYRVFLFSTAEQYGLAGGPPASGGHYDGRNNRMLILLPNLGIQTVGEKKAFDYQRNLFVVKHEVTHLLLRYWGESLPIWFSEGLAEVIAAAPYTRARYTFTAMDTAMRSYVQKWRSPGDTKPLYVTPPGPLMSMSPEVWQARVSAQTAYELYNSAALFAYFLLRYDGAGDGGGVAGFLESLRRGVPRDKAIAEHIRRGRSDEKLAADFRVFLRRVGLKFELEPQQPTR
jgi:hypothetical protein